MDVGLIKDRRPFEHRIGLTPGGVRLLTDKGHRVYLEDDAGLEAGFPNEVYRNVGATIVYSDEEVRLRSELLIRLSPPTPDECESYQPGQIVISAWHLAVASEDYFLKLLENKVTTVGFEIIEDDEGHAPVLEAMSEIAGRLAVTIAASLVLNEFGGKGLLLGGAPGIPPASMVILGAGTLGCEAAKFARGLGAHVVVLDNDINALRRVQAATPDEVPTMIATRPRIEKALAFADILLCAVAVHGERTPSPGHPRYAQADEAAVGDHGPFDRPGRLLRDLAADRLLEPHLRGGWHHPLLRPQPRGDRLAGIDEGADQRHGAVRRGDRRQGFRGGGAGKTRPSRRGTYTYDGHCLRKGLARTFGVPYHEIAGS